MALDKVRRLTPIEGRVASLVVAGRTDAEIAVELDLADRTVAWHLARAARKLGVRSRNDVAAALAQRGNPVKEEQ